ncbi:Hsp20/alpha crystallin family protein [Streptomyces sp. NBC_01808]|uniref:Hsp20/alpha crystallin family protein n=1 Tax=Streptomyces sp. NBC_01808 TaxID=2975947 RepID=UPI002DDC1B0C|nr:Hsp20/alpha crystallin family protein [Streptomyces sp. NBC_01808]WSA41659.1 Hsp20/alpha crystallin family protein [Streptomyces sp. NBC_01808]
MTKPVRRSGGALQTWDPFREMEDLHSRLDRLVQSAVPAVPGPGTPGAWVPLADIEDTEDAYLVELELPGVGKDDLTVEITDSEIGVHGEIREKERTGVVRRRGRHVGEFDYHASLPSNSDTGHVSAELTNGVLTIRVPKAEKAGARRIEIEG